VDYYIARLCTAHNKLTLRGRAQESEGNPNQTMKVRLMMAQWQAQRLGDLSGFGQVRHRLVEKGLSFRKRELLGLTQELFPRGGVERGP